MTDRFENLNDLECEFQILIEDLIPTIADDYRADEEFDEPSMQLTIAVNDDATKWSYQTGDNSYTGGCYGLPHWAVVYLTRDVDPVEVAREVVDQLEECLVYVEDYA